MPVNTHLAPNPEMKMPATQQASQDVSLKHCDQCRRSEVDPIISGTGTELLPIREIGEGADRLTLCEGCEQDMRARR